MDTIKININGQNIETENGNTILEVSLNAGIYIPHLCHHPDLKPTGDCGICVVEVEGNDELMISCTTQIENGMVINTKTEKIDNARKRAMEQLLVGHPPECSSCNKYLNCELQSVKQYLGVSEELSIERHPRTFPINNSNPLFTHDPNRCILCARCIRACDELKGAKVLQLNEKDEEKYVGTLNDLPLAESGCWFCGTCAEVCPTGAIQDKEELIKGKKRKAAFVSCRFTCPAEIDVPRYLRFIKQNNYPAAVAVIREKVPFPIVLGYVCDHICEDACRRKQVNQAVTIRELKRFVSENDNEEIWKINSQKKPDTGKKVAVIGSGPAGLTAAYYLSKNGHSTTVFESLPLAGGMMRVGIPEYRLPRDVLEREIKIIEESGVVIKTDTHIDSIDFLFDQGFDAVLVAIGTHRGQFLNVPGMDSDNILIGTEFLKDVNLGKELQIGKNVLVLGGGNVAFDCARISRRIGADKVTIVCLECRADMPASCDEINEGEEEGIIICPSKTMTGIVSNNGKINGAEFLDVESFSFDEDNKLQLEVADNSESMIEADTIIFAIGQRPDIPDKFELDTEEKTNLIMLDSYTFETNRQGVFAAGDAVTGTGSVIRAIASGRTAAKAIDRYLDGDGDIDEVLAPVEEIGLFQGDGKGFASMNRSIVPCTAVEDRIQSFCKIVQEIDKDTAVYESKRCLQCDSRLKITSVRFWGDY